jgi:DNA repair protein RecN (Recombination protein N)
VQVIGSSRSGAGTLIFDEVDVGVGGGVAEMVGQQLRALARGRQVLVVTHLPQVASLGTHHLRVSKRADGDVVTSAVTPVAEEERVEEVARMLGGLEITAQTRAHAEEMIARGREAPR